MNDSLHWSLYVIIIPSHYHPWSNNPMDFHPRERLGRYRWIATTNVIQITWIPHPEAATHDRSPLPRSSAVRRRVYIQDILKETIARSKSIAQVQEPIVVDDHKQPGGWETARAFWLFASRRVTITCNLQYKMLFRTLWITEFWLKKWMQNLLIFDKSR